MKQTQYWNIVIIGGVTVYVIFSLAYLFFGQPHADEGWYLYASKLVWQGNLPYQDFAYTQTPLLPYIYGLPQILFGPSIYIGRATSVLFSVITLVIYISISRKHAGRIGAVSTTLILCTFIYGIYFMSIVKTYALIAVLFALVLLVLESDSAWKYLIAIVLSFLASMARLSAVAFAIPVVVYCLFATRNKYLAILLCLALTSVAAFFFLPDIDATRWNLITHHVMQGNPSIVSRIAQVPVRMWGFASQFYIYVIGAVLLVAISTINSRKLIAPYLRHNTPMIVFAIGLILFVASHLITGGWHMEYFVPAMMGFLTLIAIVFGKVYATSDAKKHIPQVALLAVLFLSPRNMPDMPYIYLSVDAMPIERVKDVAEYISEHSDATDKIFVLDGLQYVVESNRSSLPGMAMAQFSYVNMDDEGASKLKLVNGKTLLKYLLGCEARIVVLTDWDWKILESSGYAERIRYALSGCYELTMTRPEFGQQAGNVYVYLRKGISHGRN